MINTHIASWKVYNYTYRWKYTTFLKRITQMKNKSLQLLFSAAFFYVESNSLTTLVKISSAGHGAWKEEVDDRRREGSWDILDHPDSIRGYPYDPDELEDVLDDDFEYDLKSDLNDDIGGPAEKIGVTGVWQSSSWTMLLVHWTSKNQIQAQINIRFCME